MEFRFETELGGKNAVFELRTAPLTDEDAAKKTTLRGYKCEQVMVNGEALKNPAFISCYAETNKKEGPALCFKFGMAKWMEEQFGIENKKGQALYVGIPESVQAAYLEMLGKLDQEIERLQAEAEKRRDENDKIVRDDDIIELSYSPRFVGVRYPFDSNREKIESKIWSQFDGNLDLDDWIEVHLEPYCVGLGCGCSKKYRVPYREYAALLEAYKAQL